MNKRHIDQIEGVRKTIDSMAARVGFRGVANELEDAHRILGIALLKGTMSMSYAAAKKKGAKAK